MQSQIIVATHRNQDIEFCSRVAEICGVPCTKVTSVEEIRKILFTNPCSVVFFEMDPDRINAKSVFLKIFSAAFSGQVQPGRVFGLSSIPLHEIPAPLTMNNVGHFVLRPFDDFSVVWASRLCKQLLKPAGFEQKSLQDEGVILKNIHLKSSGEKKVALEAFRRILEKNSIQSRISDLLMNALDAITMNAIFNAPQDVRKRYYQRETPREKEFVFSDKEKITMSLGINQQFITLSVTDYFGSFEPSRAFDAFRQNFTEGEYVANQKTQAAGLGLRSIFDGGLTVLMNTNAGKSTEACIAFPYFKSLKQMKTASPIFSAIRFSK